MKFEELEGIRRRIESAESEVVFAAQRLLNLCSPHHKAIREFSAPIHNALTELSEQMDSYLKAMEQLPPTDTKVEL